MLVSEGEGGSTAEARICVYSCLEESGKWEVGRGGEGGMIDNRSRN